ncbi:MAG: ketoacyl-ACP synthase III [Lachnospiraceae bacterium]|nr:ketoacyl-ACP synthase III [Lachnospiraceae bacterium]
MTIKITGTGRALPEKTVTNFDMAKLVDTSDEWIRGRTGIAERRISTGDTVSSLAAKACAEALTMAGKDAEEVDLILVATCSPELLLPCCACQVQSAIGAHQAVAFDLNAACSGFLFALNTAYAYLQTGLYQNALIVGSEVLSKLIDWTDRSTCVLFGDGAGAAFIEKTEADEVCANGRTAGIEEMVMGSDGTKGMVLACAERTVSNPYFKETETIKPYVYMNGQEVYKFATRQVPACIKEALDKANLTVDDVDLFVLHQANVRIIESVAKRLKADIAKFPMNLDRIGNMSSATIPVLLDELNRDGKIKKGDRLVLSGFGAGLTYGASILVWG